VTSPIDIYRTANFMLKEYGEDAPVQAAMRADVMLKQGDMEGYAVWKKIVTAVEELATKTPEGETVH
jgi:hypothetical protein